MTDIVERLKNPRTEQGDLWPIPNLHDEAAEEIKKLREALKPFAADAGDFDFMEDHDEVGVPVGDLRAAAAALGGADE